jgi:hypothetical protein
MKLSQFALLPLLAALPAIAAEPRVRTSGPPPPAIRMLGAGADVVLNVRHERLPSEGRREAGALVQGMVQQMVQSGYTVRFAREFVEAEAAYYRTNLSKEKSRPTAEAVLGCLETALRQGEFDWAKLAEIHRAAPDSDTVTRNLPWLQTVRDPNQLRLAPAATNGALPVVELALRWEGRRVKGIVLGRDRGRPGIGSPPETYLYTGESWLWRIAGTLAVRRGNLRFTEQSYPDIPWRERYRYFEETPLALTQEKILGDLKSGLKYIPPFPSDAPPDKPKRK